MIGQAGVGKSRLLRELERAAARSATRRRPSARAAACPYGSGIVYWALGEVIRAEAGIVDGDSADVAWDKLLDRRRGADATTPAASAAEPAERKAALIGRLLGIEAPADVAPAEAEDPQRMREASSRPCAR